MRVTLRPRIAFISFNGDPFQYDESEEQEEEKGERGERPIEKERLLSREKRGIGK